MVLGICWVNTRISCSENFRFKLLKALSQFFAIVNGLIFGNSCDDGLSEKMSPRNVSVIPVEVVAQGLDDVFLLGSTALWRILSTPGPLSES